MFPYHFESRCIPVYSSHGWTQKLSALQRTVKFKAKRVKTCFPNSLDIRSSLELYEAYLWYGLPGQQRLWARPSANSTPAKISTNSMVHNAPRMKRKRFNNKGFQGDSIMFLQIKTFPFHATTPQYSCKKLNDWTFSSSRHWRFSPGTVKTHALTRSRSWNTPDAKKSRQKPQAVMQWRRSGLLGDAQFENAKRELGL